MVDQPQLTVGVDGPLQAAHRALLARLAYAFPARQFATSTIPAHITPKTWTRLLTRTPFVAVGFSGIAPTAGARLYDGEAVWEIYIGTTQTRPDGLLLGDKLSPGVLGMASAAICVLHSQTDKGIGTWTCGPVQNLFDDKWAEDNMAVVGIKVSMLLQITDPAAAAALPDFSGFVGALSWDLPDIAPAAATLATNMGGPA